MAFQESTLLPPTHLLLVPCRRTKIYGVTFSGTHTGTMLCDRAIWMQKSAPHSSTRGYCCRLSATSPMMLWVSEKEHVRFSSLISYPFILPIYSGALSSFLPRTAHFLLKFRIISQVSGFFRKRRRLKQ